MTATITHTFVNPIADEGNPDVTGPDEWNAAHTISSKGTLSRVNDTNVTLTLGGTPTGSLLESVSLTLGWTGTLSAARGGTGAGSYAVGDILYANTTSSLAALADVATGSVLASGGVGTAPVWSSTPSITLTNCTGLPVSTGISGFGTNVAAFLATPSSANLAAAVTDETGSGALVFATSPTFVTPVLGTPTSGTLSNCDAFTGDSGAGGAKGVVPAPSAGDAGFKVLGAGGSWVPNDYVVTTFTSAAIQTAVNAASSAGGGRVRLLDGTYSVSSAIAVPSNVHVIGSGNTILQAPNDATVLNLMTMTGTGGTSTTIASNVAIGDISITLTSDAALSVGDLVELTVTQVTTGYVWFTMSRVVALPGSNVMTIADPMPFAMTTSDTSTGIYPITSVDNVVLRDLIFDGNGNSGSATRGLLATYCYRCHFSNLFADDFNNGAGIYLNHGFANSYDILKTNDCGDANEDAIVVYGQSNMTAGDIIAERSSGFGVGINYCTHSAFGKIIANYAQGRGIKMLGCLYCSFESLIGNNSTSTGVAITLATQFCDFANVKAFTNRGGSGSNDIGLWFSGQANIYNRVRSGRLANNQTYDVQLNSSDDNNVVTLYYGTSNDNGTGNTLSTTS